MNRPEIKFVYFGGEPIGVPVLTELMECGYTPSLVVCNPDRPAGRGQKLTPPPIKTLAEQHGIPVYQPENLKDEVAIKEALRDYDLFIVVAYNRIMPTWLIELPTHKTLNVHPSLLPLRRGPNPIRSAIVEDDRASIGVSIMQMDEEMDHGPILDQRALPIADENWPTPGPVLDEALANLGGALLAAVIEGWITGELHGHEQAHDKATYTTKMTKADGELTLDPHHLPDGETARELLLKIRGYAGFPGTFFFYNDKRIKVNEAELTEDDKLCLVSVTPEGKSQIPFDQWLPSSNR